MLITKNLLKICHSFKDLTYNRHTRVAPLFARQRNRSIDMLRKRAHQGTGLLWIEMSFQSYLLWTAERSPDSDATSIEPAPSRYGSNLVQTRVVRDALDFKVVSLYKLTKNPLPCRAVGERRTASADF